MNGVPPEDHIGKTVQEVVPDIGPQAEQALRTVLTTGQHLRVEFRGQTHAQPGVERIWDEHWYPLRTRDGEVIGVGVVAEEVTERRRIESELAQAQLALQQHAANLEKTVAERTGRLRDMVHDLEIFSYSIAHDMRAPLRAMQGFSEVLLEEYSSKLDPIGQDFLHRIATSANRMDQLIHDVLNYSQILRAEFPLECVDIDPLLRGIIDIYPFLAPEKTDVALCGSIPPVLANEAMLTQVLSNLLGNAVKFVATGARPSIEIWAENVSPDDSSTASAHGNHFVRIHVRDNGIGIHPDQHEKIFAMFQRVDKEYEGTGIGLAIVRKAVERMGGKVGVDSQPGQGNTFWFELHKF